MPTLHVCHWLKARKKWIIACITSASAISTAPIFVQSEAVIEQTKLLKQKYLNKSDPLSLSKIDSERASRHHITHQFSYPCSKNHRGLQFIYRPLSGSQFWAVNLCIVASGVLLLSRLSRIYQPLVVLFVWVGVSFSPTPPYPRTWKSSSNHSAPITELGSISKCSPCTLLSLLFSCWTPWITHNSCTPDPPVILNKHFISFFHYYF